MPTIGKFCDAAMRAALRMLPSPPTTIIRSQLFFSFSLGMVGTLQFGMMVAVSCSSATLIFFVCRYLINAESVFAAPMVFCRPIIAIFYYK